MPSNSHSGKHFKQNRSENDRGAASTRQTHVSHTTTDAPRSFSRSQKARPLTPEQLPHNSSQQHFTQAAPNGGGTRWAQSRQWTMPDQRNRSHSYLQDETMATHLSGEVNRYRRGNYGKQRRSLGPWGITGRIVAALLILFLSSLAITGFMMYSQIGELRSQANSLQENLLKGDPAVAQQAAESIASHSKRLNDLARWPQWTIASAVPFIGSDFAAVQTFASIADDLSSHVLVPMTDDMAIKQTGPIMAEGDRFNAPAIQSALETLDEEQTIVHSCCTRVQTLNIARIGQIDKLRRQLCGVLGALDLLSKSSRGLSPNMPYLLGAEGEPRRYLFIALSSAEVRSIGGLPGSYGILTIDNGKISVGDFLALKDTPRLVPTSEEDFDTETVAPGLTDEERVLFGRRVVNVPAETATNPQFSRFAESFRYLYSFRNHGDTDGAVAIDTDLLENILGVTGGVLTGDGTMVDGSNASRLLLHDTYSTKTSDEQDAFFSEVAALCFNQLFADTSAEKITNLMQTIWHASKTRHLQIWVPNTQVEESLETLGYAGEVSTSEEEPVLGVYVNDDTWSKIAWYLSVDTKISSISENADGSRTYRATTTLQNHLTPEEAALQPDYVVGSNWRKRSRADMLDWLFFYAPLGGSITDMEADAYFTPVEKTRSGFNGIEQIAGMNRASHLDHEVWFGQIQLDAGEVATISYTVTTSPNTQTNYLTLDQTPTAQKSAGW